MLGVSRQALSQNLLNGTCSRQRSALAHCPKPMTRERSADWEALLQPSRLTCSIRNPSTALLLTTAASAIRHQPIRLRGV